MPNSLKVSLQESQRRTGPGGEGGTAAGAFLCREGRGDAVVVEKLEGIVGTRGIGSELPEDLLTDKLRISSRLIRQVLSDNLQYDADTVRRGRDPQRGGAGRATGAEDEPWETGRYPRAEPSQTSTTPSWRTTARA